MPRPPRDHPVNQDEGHQYPRDRVTAYLTLYQATQAQLLDIHAHQHADRLRLEIQQSVPPVLKRFF